LKEEITKYNTLYFLFQSCSGCLENWNDCSKFLQNVRNQLPNYMAYYPRKMETSTIPP
jgi:hypothetical protein